MKKLLAITFLAALSIGIFPASAAADPGTIRVTPFFGTAILSDQDRNDIDPFLVRSKLDIQASNGIAHGISFVLRPADL